MHLFARIPARTRRPSRLCRALAGPRPRFPWPRSAPRRGAACLLCLAALLPPTSASAQETAPGAGAGTEIESLRAEVKELREQVLALKRQIEALQAGPTAPASPAPAAETAPSAAPPTLPEPGAPSPEPPPAAAPPPKTPSLLNPAISAVFQ